MCVDWLVPSGLEASELKEQEPHGTGHPLRGKKTHIYREELG
jgi:hypothetical protein